KLNGFLGADLTLSAVTDILTRLDFAYQVMDGETIVATVPVFRQDVSQAVDVYEEVARIAGYDKLPASAPVVRAHAVQTDSRRIQRQKIAAALRSSGLDEIVTFSLVSRAALAKSGLADVTAVPVINALSKEQEVLRPSLLPSMLAALLTNCNRGQKNIKIFETGKLYTPAGETETAAVLLSGQAAEDWRDTKKPAVDFYDLKGIVDKALLTVAEGGLAYQAGNENFLAAGQACRVVLAGEPLGFLGRVSPRILAEWDIKSKEVYFAQINLEKLYKLSQPIRKYQPPPEFPGIVRDISLSVSRDIEFQTIQDLALSGGQGLLASVVFLEEYIGEKIAKDQRGLVFSLTYQAADRTLREEEVNAVHETLVQRLLAELPATRR
ncbi:MAG: hypothetical protein HQL23_09455, partial [Candidatus Omnitrophica bacterium]|nr:hypothetical protein [Candidatus Omnitrophota bacterium]